METINGSNGTVLVIGEQGLGYPDTPEGLLAAFLHCRAPLWRWRAALNMPRPGWWEIWLWPVFIARIFEAKQRAKEFLAAKGIRL